MIVVIDDDVFLPILLCVCGVHAFCFGIDERVKNVGSHSESKLGVPISTSGVPREVTPDDLVWRSRQLELFCLVVLLFRFFGRLF